MVLKAGSSLATACTQCGKHGTRSITGLCLACGGQKAIKRISAKKYYYRKKKLHEDQRDNI
jgi:ribosomal protein L37E